MPAIVNHKERLAYVPIPKAGYTSISIALRETWGLPLPDPWWKVHDLTWDHPGIEWLPDASVLPNRVLSMHFFAFSVIRDPWSRLESAYRHLLRADRIGALSLPKGYLWPEMSFEELVEKVCALPRSGTDWHFTTQHSLLHGPTRQRLAHAIIDISLLGFYWPQVPRMAEAWDARHGLHPTHRTPFKPLQRLNVGEGPRVKWTRKLLDQVAEHYQEDLEMYPFVRPEV
jgi:hypothetical protein